MYFMVEALCHLQTRLICRVEGDDENLIDRKSPDAQARLSQELSGDLRRQPYRLWYTIEVQSSAPNPERTLEVTCAAHSVVAVDIAVTNPTRERLVMDVLIDGVALSGEPTVTLHPRQQVIYQIRFAPTVIGEYTGRLAVRNCSFLDFKSFAPVIKDCFGKVCFKLLAHLLSCRYCFQCDFPA